MIFKFKILLFVNIIKLSAKGFVTAILVVSSVYSFASYPEEQPGARAASLGYGVAGIWDGWSLFHNQAGLGYFEDVWVGVHHENRFLSPDLSFSALGGIIPVKPGALGVSIKRLGFSKFSQTQAGISYGMKLSPTLSAGIQANVHHVYIEGEYGSTTAFTAEGGIIYNPSNNFSVGLHIFNPTRSKIYHDERIPTRINLGLAYRFGEMVTLVSGVEKDIENDATFKAGIEFTPVKNLYFRTGINSNPTNLSFGMGYSVANLQMDIAFSYHQHLGYTPHISLSYLFSQRTPKNNEDSGTP